MLKKKKMLTFIDPIRDAVHHQTRHAVAGDGSHFALAKALCQVQDVEVPVYQHLPDVQDVMYRMLKFLSTSTWRSRTVLKRYWQARGRGGKEVREVEKQVQTNRQELTVGLGKEISKGRNSTIYN